MNWLALSFLALVLWGIWGFLGKVASLHLASPEVYLLTISGHLVVVAYLLLTGAGPLVWQPLGVGAALTSGICMAVALLFFFQALAQGPVAVVVPLTGLYPAVTVILGALILHESLPPHRLVGICLALLAVWLLSR